MEHSAGGPEGGRPTEKRPAPPCRSGAAWVGSYPPAFRRFPREAPPLWRGIAASGIPRSAGTHPGQGQSIRAYRRHGYQPAGTEHFTYIRPTFIGQTLISSVTRDWEGRVSQSLEQLGVRGPAQGPGDITLPITGFQLASFWLQAHCPNLLSHTTPRLPNWCMQNSCLTQIKCQICLCPIFRL